VSDSTGLSVMIPTWRPDPRYLEAAVESVLAQLSPAQAVQVELVDDGSPDFDVEAFARRFGPGRVDWHRNGRRRGLAGNWNACVARARYPWVHLLHQDDFLLDGFYEAILYGIKRAPHAAAAFTASHFVDSKGAGWAPRLIPMSQPGILTDWLEHVFVNLSIQCSAMVVRGDVYKELGGFQADLPYTLDWEMWKRIAVRYPIWFEPRPLACFRKHPGSETGRQRPSGEHVMEIFQSIDRSGDLLPREAADRTVRRARRHYAVFTAEEAMTIARSPGGLRKAFDLLNVARRQTSSAAAIAALGKAMARACLRPMLVRRASTGIKPGHGQGTTSSGRGPAPGHRFEQESPGVNGLSDDQ